MKYVLIVRKDRLPEVMGPFTDETPQINWGANVRDNDPGADCFTLNIEDNVPDIRRI